MDYLSDFKSQCWVEELQELRPYASYRHKQESQVGNERKFISKKKIPSKAKGFRLMSSIFKERAKKGKPWRMRCLPYLHVIGVTKSGTTDLYDKIMVHPDVFPAAVKEPTWWNRRTLGVKSQRAMEPFSRYLDLFDYAAEMIRRNTTQLGGEEYHPLITVEGTPSYLWDYDGWKRLPVNQGLLEPRIILAHTLRKLNPEARILVIVREPVDRLYSQFRMNRGSNPDRFHQFAAASVQKFRQCMTTRTARSCAYDPPAGTLFFRASLYSVFIRDWLSVFPRDQLLVIRGEDYYANRADTMQKIFKFLDFSPLPPDLAKAISHGAVVNARRSMKMRSHTKTLLTDFYKPFNEELSALLNDSTFLWQS